MNDQTGSDKNLRFPIFERKRGADSGTNDTMHSGKFAIDGQR